MSDEHEHEMPEEITVPIEDSIDLHPFRPKDVRSVVESYLEGRESLRAAVLPS